MAGFNILTASEQVASHLRAELARGTWGRTMPGGDRLAAELGVGRDTIKSALQQLEDEGLLQGQGRRRRRLIVAQQTPREDRQLQVRILPYEEDDRNSPDLLELQRKLHEAGVGLRLADQTLTTLGMNLERVARMVRNSKADAWVVCAGSMPVLRWFSQSGVPTFAMFGRPSGLPLAGMGVRKAPAMTRVIRRLVALGHRRIVLMTREDRRKPGPAVFEQSFLNELALHGINPGPYHLPDWSGGPEGFHQCLDTLFQISSPTAMLVIEAPLFIAARDHLARRGLHAPRHISLICDDPDPSFRWSDPPVTHMRWDYRPIVRRVVDWVENIRHGRQDLQQGFVHASLVEGGTIGPVPSQP
jgi:DNA-binding LacI/PurR family transcriptional regulator/biotin operon repressor